MAKETKPKNPFSTKNWKRLEALPSGIDRLDNMWYTTYYGTLNGERSYYLVGAFNDEFYAYSICVENLSQFQKLKERLNGLNCTFKVNKSVNPFNNAAAWEKHDCGSGDSYLARISSNRKCYIGMFGGQCYIMPTRYKQYGRERDWIVALGVCVID